MKNADYAKVIATLKSVESIAIFMHINPDCDCISSAIALYSFLKKDGKEVSFFSPELTNASYIINKFSFLPYIDKFNISNINNYDLSIAVDVGDVTRLGDTAFKKFIKSKKSIVIDHHEISNDFAQITLRESESASTTQILYKLMCEYNKNLIDRDIATLLYSGLVTDSGCFSFDNTTPETHHIASELLKYNINVAIINEKLIRDIQLNVFNLKNRVLSKTKFYENNRIGIIVFRLNDFEETQTSINDTDGIINNVINIIGVDLAIAISEVAEKRYKLSFRSKNNVNAAACAKCFGGGGHYRAAGCRLYGYFEDVLEKVLSVAKEMISDD